MRRRARPRSSSRRKPGPGDSTYQGYDDRITEAAVSWLTERARKQAGKPWVLFVSLVCPHFPLIARPEWYNLYPEDAVPWPAQYAEEERPNHPFIAATREIAIYDKAFDERKVRRAIAAYFGLVSFLDHNVGRIMDAIAQSGLGDSTRVVYTSDHGDNLGARGLWGKSNLYEDSVGVPMLMAGPGIPSGMVCHEPVSLVDGFPTILDCVGAPRDSADADLPGTSLFTVMRGLAPPRTVLSEYHASGSVTGAFMIRKGDFKYVAYPGMPPQLFDLAADPWEARDLAMEPRLCRPPRRLRCSTPPRRRPRCRRPARAQRSVCAHRKPWRTRCDHRARHLRLLARARHETRV